jgi:hypothetical protein
MQARIRRDNLYISFGYLQTILSLTQTNPRKGALGIEQRKQITPIFLMHFRPPERDKKKIGNSVVVKEN